MTKSEATEKLRAAAIAENLEAHCTKVEAEAWGIFREMSDEAEERGEWGGTR